MKKILFSLIAALGLVAGSAQAAEGGIAWDKAPSKTNDLGALQNGAKLFVNYCVGCHSAAFMRYNRLTDIGLTEGQIKDNLLFTTEKIGDTMKATINPADAKQWFGANPPDLTVIARSRAGHGGTGSDYLYTFLRTFYRDDTKATGWNNLLFTTEKIGDTMKATINPADAKQWFGANPPDLTVIARSRAGHGGTGSDYLYTFLRTFYRDDTKATGWNNLVFPNVGMPHALWQLQGDRRPVFEAHESHGKTTETFKGWEQVSAGTMTPLQYDQAIGDLVGYLQWMGEPAQNTRVRIGVWVLLFLGVMTVLAWKLNGAFWKDVK